MFVEPRPSDETGAWALLLAIAGRAGEGRPVAGAVGLRLDDDGRLDETSDDPWIVLEPGTPRGWRPARGASAIAPPPAVETLLDLYLPLCVGEAASRLVIGHLGQTLDGRIATISGRSQFITSKENLVHAHRLRALCDVVLVGRRTVQEDDPQLTTRMCTGRNPVRVIVDPDRRLPPEHRVFTDGQAPTFLFCRAESAEPAKHGAAEVIGIEPVQGRLPVQAILAELRRRGLRRVYIEGGGVTVSRFVEARALTRLHVAVAPVLFGSGRSTLTLPEIDDLSQALVLECRQFAMGRDVMFDCIFADRRG